MQLSIGSRFSELQELKSALSSYLVLEQAWDDTTITSTQGLPIPRSLRAIDPRYRQWMGLVSNRENGSTPVMNSDISVVTWNYDSQIEKAYAQPLGAFEFSTIQEQLNVWPRSSSLKNLKKANIDGFNLIKLNGSAGYLLSGEEDCIGYLHSIVAENKIEAAFYDAMNLFACCTKYRTFSPLINFAWERNNLMSEHSRNQAKEIFQKTEVLIVIGYSFPDTNIDVDREMLQSLGKPQVIYIQDKVPELIIERMTSLSPILDMNKKLFTQVSDLDRFVINRS